MTVDAAIIVIAFNEERSVGPCLNSLLTQDAESTYEVIVVDDGSQDGTVKVVEQLQVQYRNLRLVRHEVNRGRGAARRSGQDAAESPRIGFVDADIVVPSNWLKRCLEELDKLDGVSGIAQPDGDCAVIWRICKPTLRDRPGSAEITGNNVLFSREALTLVPFSPNSKLGEDFRLAKLMTRSGLRLRTIEDLKVMHRETKTYWGAISWMWESGVDSTSLLFEFRVIRPPDLAWFTWSVGCVVAVAAGVLGKVPVWQSIVAIAAFTLVINLLFIYSRFKPRPRPMRFLGVLMISPPMMLAYLAGRSAGLFRAPLLLRRFRGSAHS